MNIQIGQEVLFARNYKDIAREGVIVRDIGTFYIGVPPTDGVNVVRGRIEPIKRGVSYPIYDMYMNFDKAGLLACTNVQHEKVNTERLIRDIGINDCISFPTLEEAREAYEYLCLKKVRCQLRGKMITDIRSLEYVHSLLDTFKKSKKKPRFKRTQHNFSDEIEDNFEI